MKSVSEFVSRNPWLYIVFAFLLLLAAWSALISVAVKYSPEQIEIKR
jgi:Na+-transporting methylmalonyl-CoA/oxaloacetate decarboxylase gamma subunit